MSQFIPLHLHSHFSLMDGLSKPQDIVKTCIDRDYDACALTDHGSIAGAVQFSKLCEKKNIKPILGSELYVSSQHASVKDQTNRKHSHLVVLAKNLKGWKTLIQITSGSNSEANFYYKPRLSLDQIAEYADGNLIAFSGHLGSELANVLFQDGLAPLAYEAKTKEAVTALLHPDFKRRARILVEKYVAIFGKENFFIEIQRIDIKNMVAAEVVSDILRWLATSMKHPTLATADSHYPNKVDAVDQQVLLCSSMGTILSVVQDKINKGQDVQLGSFFKSKNYHIPQLEEMMAVNTQEEIANTLLVRDMCENYSILRNPDLPHFQCPNNRSEEEHLRYLCREGYRKHFMHLNGSKRQEYGDRVNKELSVLTEADLSGYFLIVQDIVQYGKSRGWLMGPGRGSAGGCLVSYLIGITSIDPIPPGLIFERFYNAGRNTAEWKSLPDIDVDVPTDKRDELIAYIKNKYGHAHVSQMITFQRLQGKGAIKEVLRAHGACSAEEMDKITKYIPDEPEIADQLELMRQARGEASILQWTLENIDANLSEWVHMDENGKLQGRFAKYFEQAIRLEGTKTHQSKHAAGVVISKEPLAQVAPMIRDPSTGNLIAGMEMADLEAIGLVKFDILGVRILDKIMGVARRLRER